MCFVALLLFDTKFPVDTGVSVAMTLVGLFNIIAMCMVPGGVMPNLIMNRTQSKRRQGDTDREDGESSDNNADDQDHMLPMTYGSHNDRGNSNKPERSDI